MGPTKGGPIWAGKGTQPIIMTDPVGQSYGHPLGAHCTSRFIFLFVIARPLAFGSFPARIMPTLRVGIWKIEDFPL